MILHLGFGKQNCGFLAVARSTCGLPSHAVLVTALRAGSLAPSLAQAFAQVHVTASLARLTAASPHPIPKGSEMAHTSLGLLGLLLALLALARAQKDGRRSLTFVFDSTGSMDDDLDAVKSGIRRIAASYAKFEHISNFILIKVHDPGEFA